MNKKQRIKGLVCTDGPIKERYVPLRPDDLKCAPLRINDVMQIGSYHYLIYRTMPYVDAAKTNEFRRQHGQRTLTEDEIMLRGIIGLATYVEARNS